MQRLEVSGAVRPIYVSSDVKRLSINHIRLIREQRPVELTIIQNNQDNVWGNFYFSVLNLVVCIVTLLKYLTLILLMWRIG